MGKNNKIIYAIGIEDVQNVAEENLSKKLSAKELKIVEDKLGDYIDWYQAIENCITNHICHNSN